MTGAVGAPGHAVGYTSVRWIDGFAEQVNVLPVREQDLVPLCQGD